jgi:hypothetical protein
MKSSFGYRFVLALSLFNSFSTANAVEITARIEGTITDPSGAVVPNAQVTATNIDTGVVTTRTTSSAGDYIFQKLPIGAYSISVSVPGFSRYTATGIMLNIDQKYVLPIKLSVGSPSETIEVKANGVQVNTIDMQLSNVVESHQSTELPLIGRNFTNLELILPGVQASNDRFNNNFSVNGSQSQQSAYVINGADTNELGLNTIAFQPNIDALQEFNFLTGPLNAEYDRNSGAIISAAIKQGTNRIHGSAFEFYRDTFLNTRNYFQKNPITLPTPTFHQNIFGGTVGGPILHNKLFAFGAYQGTRQAVPQGAGNVTVFTAAQLAGDYTSSVFPTNKFSAKNVIPATVNIPGCASGKDTFATCLARLKGVVPASAFSPISVNLAKTYVPAPNTGSNVYTFSPIQANSIDQYIGRFDFNPTQVNQFYFVGIHEHGAQTDTLPFSGATIPGFGDKSDTILYQFSAGWIRTFGSSAVNDLGIHYTRLNGDTLKPQHVVAPSSLGFSISPQNTASQSVPIINLLGADTSQPNFTMGFSVNSPQPHIEQVHQANDSFARTFGHHNLKFGYDWRKYTWAVSFSTNNNGSFAFNTTSNIYSSGNIALDYLLGVPATYAQGSGTRTDTYAYLNYLYAQDTWKAMPSLTLSYGLGWQIDTPLYSLQYGGIGVTCFLPGQQSKIFSTAPVGLNYPGDPGCNNASGATTKYYQFGPRFGFAWTPELGVLSGGASNKLSIRGGYGIYYNRTEAETALQTISAPPFGVNSTGAVDYGLASNPSFANPYQDLNVVGAAGSYPNKFPFVPPAAGATPSFAVYKPFSLSQLNPAFRSPYSENVQLTVEREFPGLTVARMSYVGTFGRHNQAVIEGNPITQAGHDACLADPTCVTNRRTQSVRYPTHSQYGYADPTFNRGQNPFTSIGLVSSISTSNYNSLQLSLNKSLTHGLALQASYTLSHSLDDASSFEGSALGGAPNGRSYNQFVKGLNYGNSTFDVRHRFVIAPIYVVPFKPSGGAFSAYNLLFSGWQLSGIASFATGAPFDVLYGSNSASPGNSLWCSPGPGMSYYACPDIPQQVAPIVRPDIRTMIVNPTTGASTNRTAFFKTPGLFLGTSPSFVDETIGTFGNVSRNKYHGPGINNTNIIIAKNFALSSDNVRYLQLRMESDNVFNHTQFSKPIGSFTTPNFGAITSAAAGRQTQLAVKFYF